MKRGTILAMGKAFQIGAIRRMSGWSREKALEIPGEECSRQREQVQVC